MTLIDVPSLVQTLKSRGVTFERKPEGGVRVHSPHPLEPELLEAVKTYKLEILESLEKGFSPLNKTRTLERLPWELERLVSAASNGVLPSNSTCRLSRLCRVSVSKPLMSSVSIVMVMLG